MSKQGKGKGKGKGRGSISDRGSSSVNEPASSPFSASEPAPAANPLFPRSSDADNNALAGSMQQLSLDKQSSSTSVALHKPLPAGTRGLAVTVLTNHFKLHVKGLPPTIYFCKATVRRSSDNDDDDDDDDATKVPSTVKRRVLELLLHSPGYNQVFTDYDKTLVSFDPLGDQVATVDYYDREEGHPRTGADRLSFDVVISSSGAQPLPTEPFKQLPAGSADMPERAREFEDAINLILQRCIGQNPQMSSTVRDNRVFRVQQQTSDNNLTKGLLAYRGFVRRARLLYDGHRLLLNTTTAAMYQPGSLARLIQAFGAPGQMVPPSRIHDLINFLKRLRIQGNFGPRRVRTICSVAYNPATGKLLTVSDVRFHCDTKPGTNEHGNFNPSVKMWFDAAYKKNIDPTGLVVNVSSKAKPVWWPVELCTVPAGQVYRSLLQDAEQERNMIRIACQRPAVNIGMIQDQGLPLLGIQTTPLRIDMHMSTVHARKIDSPALQFAGRESQVRHQETCKGQWNLKGRKFKQGATKRWAVVVFRRASEPMIQNYTEFTKSIKTSISSYCGHAENEVAIGRDVVQTWMPANPEPSLRQFFDKCRKNRLQYCFVIPSDPKWYSAIKRAADRFGIQTTVTLRMPNGRVKDKPSEIGNLMLKYNLKCGGINWTANIAATAQALGFGSNIMFMGADVIHPPAGAMSKAPSCAAVVASVSPEPAQFPGHVELQHNPDAKKKSEEMILNLEIMAISRLRLWRARNNGRLPETIIMYRDGVSDGQFEQSLRTELPLLQKACQTVYGEAGSRQRAPRIIWQVCKKDHPARFYGPEGYRGPAAFDNHRNPLPGLIVDTSVVTRNLCDWYAVPHKAIQGTAKPTHHYLLHSSFAGTGAAAANNMDGIQTLTHLMSFIFSRSVTSISNPSPARLADCLCDRAKHHLYPVYYPVVEPEAPRPEYRAEQHWRGQADVHPDLRDTMYYL